MRHGHPGAAAATAAGGGSGARTYAALALALAMALVPLWSVDVPPLIDYHNHLARQHILAKLPMSEHLQTFYQADWRVAPYLAMDVIVQGLAKFMPVDLAGRVFLSLTLGLFALSPIALSLAVNGRVTPWALLGLLTVHNETLSLGFVHYLFSVGLGMCMLALWIRCRQGEPHRLLLFPLLSFVLFFSHLIGFVIYGVILTAYELAQFRDRLRQGAPVGQPTFRRWEVVTLGSFALQFLLPLAIFFGFGPPATVVSQNVYGGLPRKFDLLVGSFEYLMPPYLWALDRHLVWIIPGVLLVLLLARTVTVARVMVWPVVALFVLFMVTPWSLFGGFGADHRLLPAIGVLIAGSLSRGPCMSAIPRFIRPAAEWFGRSTGHLVRVPALTHAAPALVHLIVAGFVVIRIAAVTLEWRKADEEYAEYLRAVAQLPHGARLYFAFAHAANARQGHRPKYFIPLLAVARRDVYLPYLFTSNSNPGINLRYIGKYDALQYLSPGPKLTHGQAPNWGNVTKAFDYVLIGGKQYLTGALPASLVSVYDGTDFTLFRNTAVHPQRP